MSTPHIAGLVALLQQYKQLTSNRILTVDEIERALKSSDKNITDTNGLNYTRINAYTSLLSLYKMIVTLNSPLNNINLSNKLINFNCSLRYDNDLANVSLYINQDNNFTLNQTNFITGTSNTTNFTLNLNDGDYNWNCLVYDNKSNSAFASSNFTFRIDTLNPSLDNINANSITENSATITWTTNEISNSTVYYSNTLTNSDYVLSHSITLTSLISNTTYYYNVSSCDLLNNCNTSMQFSFTTLTSAPSSNSGGSSGSSGGSSGGGGSKTNNLDDVIKKPNNEITQNEVIEKPEEPIKTIENKVEGVQQVQGEKTSFTQKLLNIITGKTTITGKVIENQNEKMYQVIGLSAIFGGLCFFIFKMFLKD